MRIFYIDRPPTLVVEGSRQWFPAQGLALTRIGDLLEVWTATDNRRVAGPLPYQAVQDQQNNTFASADEAESYLLAEFGKGPERVEDIADLVAVFESNLTT